MVLGNESDETESDGSRIVALLISIDDGLQTCTLSCSSLVVGHYRSTDGLGGILGHVEHLGVRLQRAVGIVGTRGIAIHEGKALTTVGLHLQCVSLGGTGCHFVALAVNGHYPQLVVGGRQSYGIGASVVAVVAHQLLVHLCVVSIRSALDVEQISGGARHFLEFHVSRLQPAFGLQHLDLSCDGYCSLSEADGLYISLEGKAALRLVDGDIGTAELNAADGCCVVILLRAVFQRQYGLVLVRVLCSRIVRLCHDACAEACRQDQQGEQC